MTTSCSSPDPGEVTFMERQKGSGPDTTPTPTPTPPSSSGNTDAGGSTSSGGPVTAFSGAPAFTAGTAAQNSAQAGHGTGNPSNAFLSCQDCHKTGGTASPWAMAGTVATDSTSNTGVAGAEVRMVDSTGKQLASVYTDANGNFWVDAIPNGLPAGAKVGVRNATATKEMGTAMSGVGDGACNKAGCHGSGGTGHIYLK